MDTIRMRALAPDEVALLEQATLGNMNWCGERFTLADVRERPEFAHYTRIVPERGDFGVVAEQDGEVLGVAWAVFLRSSDPGYGFVDEHTPEVSLWVDGNARRQGLGRILLQALISETVLRGIGQLSLSVEDCNYAKTLYASEGFEDVSPGGEADGIMLHRLH
ncbi:MAG: GNAT family N-acetyltransferase [Ancrocorticia sp.]